MNKSELITSISEISKLTKKDSEIALNLLMDTIGEGLVETGEVRIADFGIFTAKNRNARTGVHPSTGESITIAARTVPNFKFYKSVKERINS